MNVSGSQQVVSQQAGGRASLEQAQEEGGGRHGADERGSERGEESGCFEVEEGVEDVQAGRGGREDGEERDEDLQGGESGTRGGRVGRKRDPMTHKHSMRGVAQLNLNSFTAGLLKRLVSKTFFTKNIFMQPCSRASLLLALASSAPTTAQGWRCPSNTDPNEREGIKFILCP